MQREMGVCSYAQLQRVPPLYLTLYLNQRYHANYFLGDTKIIRKINTRVILCLFQFYIIRPTFLLSTHQHNLPLQGPWRRLYPSLLHPAPNKLPRREVFRSILAPWCSDLDRVTSDSLLSFYHTWILSPPSGCRVLRLNPTLQNSAWTSAATYAAFQTTYHLKIIVIVLK